MSDESELKDWSEEIASQSTLFQLGLYYLIKVLIIYPK